MKAHWPYLCSAAVKQHVSTYPAPAPTPSSVSVVAEPVLEGAMGRITNADR
jgi:hypothetical protein